MSKKNSRDQYYTDPYIADKVFKKTNELFPNFQGVYLEPCMGTGAFFNLFPENRRIGLDLEPKCEGVGAYKEPTDFLKWSPVTFDNMICISNPPFGFASSLAVRFFNRLSSFPQIKAISFIVPKTFRKKSVQNRLDSSMHLIHEEDLPKNSFILEGKPYDVPTIFQVWEKRSYKRKKTKLYLTSPHFEFSTEDDFDFAVRRVGGRAGELIELPPFSKSSTYFLKAKGNKDDLLEAIQKMNLRWIRNQSSGVRSISKPELIKEIEKLLKKT